METYLQIILIFVTLGLNLFIINKVRLRALELRYTLLWLFASGVLFLLALFPGIVDALSDLLHIKESVNTIFLLTNFFMIMIIFSLTRVLSEKTSSIIVLTQEIGLLKLEMNKLSVKQNDILKNEQMAEQTADL